MTNLDSVLKSRNTANKVSNGLIWLWQLGLKEGRMRKYWCLWTVVLEKTAESPSVIKETKPVNLKWDQPWMFTERTNFEAEAAVFWPSDENRGFFGKVHDTGKDWGQKEKRASEDEMAGWHHQYAEHELRQTLGDGEGHAGLLCFRPWGCKESDTVGQLNNWINLHAPCYIFLK